MAAADAVVRVPKEPGQKAKDKKTLDTWNSLASTNKSIESSHCLDLNMNDKKTKDFKNQIKVIKEEKREKKVLKNSYFNFSIIFLNMKPLLEEAPRLLVI